MPRQKKCRHRADGEECLLTFPFIGQGRRRISAFRVTKQSTKLRRLSKTTRSRVHVQTVGLNAETKKVSAPSRRGRMSLDIPFYRTFPNHLATIRALRVTENLKNNEVFGPSCVALIRLHRSTTSPPVFNMPGVEAMWCSVRRSDASARTLVLPAPIAPVIMSKDSVIARLLFNHAIRSEVARMGQESN